jgi:hypothetical protein
MSESESLGGFIEKWQARWPEWHVAATFVPQAQRHTAEAWFALRQELTDAAWSGQDPRPGEAKLAWWAEELHGWSQGRRRHPLGSALQRLPASWALLAACLPALRVSRERQADAGQAIDTLEPFAEAVAGIAASLFASPTPAPAARVVVGLLAEQVLQVGEPSVPLHVMAARRGDAGGHDVSRLWAGDLLRRWPEPRDGSRPGRIQAALVRARLQQYVSGGAADLPRSHWSVLFTAWRAARG